MRVEVTAAVEYPGILATKEKTKTETQTKNNFSESETTKKGMPKLNCSSLGR
jgi:hypothetical protein